MLTPVSFRVGTVGQLLVRSGPHVTSRRKSPELTNGAQPLESATACTCPPSTAALVSAPPLNGTWTHLMPCSLAICSMVMCKLVPAPGVPYLILPGFALASAIRSWNVFHCES